MTPNPDVLVVGGGVIGCAVAYELAKRSVHVTLLDKSMPGRATSASAGGLWPVGEAVGLGCGVIYHRSPTNGDRAATNNEHVTVLPDGVSFSDSSRWQAIASLPDDVFEHELELIDEQLNPQLPAITFEGKDNDTKQYRA